MSIDLKKKIIQNSIKNELNALKALVVTSKGVNDKLKKLIKDNDVDAIIEYLDSDEFLLLPDLPYRHGRAFTLWKKEPTTTSHFMFTTCNTNEKYMTVPVEDAYDKHLYKNTLFSYGFVEFLRNNRVVVEKSDFFAITYTQIINPWLMSDVVGIHPHCVTYTLQEMFKTMLEWQWAHYELGSNEHMAVFCDQVLLWLGLDYRNQNTDPVVKSLMQLPNMYVAEFLAGNTSIKPQSVDPEEPLEFKLWASKKNMYDYKRDKCHDIYETCLKIKILEKKLSEI